MSCGGGLQSGDPPLWLPPASPAEPARPAAAAPEGPTDFGRGGKGSPGARISRVLFVRSVPAWISLPLLSPGPWQSAGRDGKFAAWAEVPLSPRPGQAEPTGASTSPRAEHPLLAVAIGVQGWVGHPGALPAIHPCRAWGGLCSRDGRQAVPNQLHALPDSGTGKRIPL